jgi:hypothetical protein
MNTKEACQQQAAVPTEGTPPEQPKKLQPQNGF